MLVEMVTEALARAEGGIVAEVVYQMLCDLVSSENHAFIEDILHVFLGQENEKASSEAWRNKGSICSIGFGTNESWQDKLVDCSRIKGG